MLSPRVLDLWLPRQYVDNLSFLLLLCEMPRVVIFFSVQTFTPFFNLKQEKAYGSSQLTFSFTLSQ